MTTVLLVDPGWPQSVYLILELRRAGFDVVRATPGALDHAGIGHFCRQISAPNDFSDEFIASLVRTERPDVLMPLTEEVMMKLWEFPPEQVANVFPRTSAQQRTLLLDRRAMYAFATAHGVPVPESRDLAGPGDLERVGQELGYPFVLRGTQGIGGVQVKIVRDPEQARTAFAALTTVSPAPPFAQRMIQGRRCLIGGLFVEGRMLQWYSQTTVEANSPPTGPSIRVRSIASPKLTGYTENLFRGFGWTGLACAEFMLDEAGEFHFMEINPRPWAAIQAAHVCGVPLLRSFAQFLRDPSTPLPPIPFAVGKDVALFPQYFATRVREGPASVVKSLPTVLSSLALAPWRHPRAVLHYLRQMWWQRG